VLLDTSAAVALCAQDHPNHAAVIRRIGNRSVGLAGHAWFETFSVLTRLPPPQRRSAADVLTLLRTNFPATVFPSREAQTAFTEELDHLGIAGGAIYDGLVALAARAAGLALLSGDRRAAATYAAMNVEVSFVASTEPGP
jgi:predicted nucleic acid-binding protein